MCIDAISECKDSLSECQDSLRASTEVTNVERVQKSLYLLTKSDFVLPITLLSILNKIAIAINNCKHKP